MSEETTKADNSRTIKMNDGREVRFGEKTRMKKEYGVSDQGLIFCRIDFDNGESIEVLVDPNSEVGQQALGHGLSQKLGDAAAGAESTEDAFEAVIEVAKQISAGKWNKAREGGGGSAKGASDLVIALAEVLGKEKETVRHHWRQGDAEFGALQRSDTPPPGHPHGAPISGTITEMELHHRPALVHFTQRSECLLRRFQVFVLVSHAFFSFSWVSTNLARDRVA